MQRAPGDIGVQGEAAAALGNLGGGALSSTKDLIVSEGALEILLLGIIEHGECESYAAQTLRCIGNLAYGGKRWKDKITQVGGLQAVMHCMKENPSSQHVSRWGCHAIGNLAYGEAPNHFQEAAAQCGCLELVTKVTLKSLQLLQKRCINEPTDEVQDVEVFRGSNGAAGVQFGATAMGHLAFRHPVNQESLRVLGSLRILRDALIAGLDDIRLLAACLQSTASLLAESEAACEEAHELELGLHILNAAKSHPDQVLSNFETSPHIPALIMITLSHPDGPQVSVVRYALAATWQLNRSSHEARIPSGFLAGVGTVANQALSDFPGDKNVAAIAKKAQRAATAK